MRTGPNKVEIDGAIMVVCSGCARLGRAVGGGIVRPSAATIAARVRPLQPSFRSAPAPAAMQVEYDVDPEYNVKIRQARERMGLSQEDLGRILNEKPSVIRMVESKKLKPDSVLVRKLTHQLKITLMVPLSELEDAKQGA